VVSGITDDLVVCSSIFCIFFPRCHMLPLGRNNGAWWYWRPAGAFYCYLRLIPQWPDSSFGAIGSWGHKRPVGPFFCNLYRHPSGTNTDFGASVVIGGLNGLLVHSVMVYTILHLGRGLLMGRGAWKDRRIAGTSCHYLASFISWPIIDFGAWSMVAQAGCGCLLL
jgi:hypothetical protein